MNINIVNGTVAAGTTVAGTGSVSSDVLVDGLIIVKASNSTLISDATLTVGGLLEIGGTLSGAGTVALGSGTTLQVDGPVNGGTIQFLTGAAERLILNNPSFSGTIVNLRDQDTIQFADGITVTNSVVSNGTLTIKTQSGTTTGTITALLAPNTGSAIQNPVLIPNSVALGSRTLTWTPTGGSTDAGSSANWITLSTGTKVPGAGDIAQFTTAIGSGVITGSITGGEYLFTGVAPWILQGASTVLTYTINTDVGLGGVPGTLTIAQGATLLGLTSQPDYLEGTQTQVTSVVVTDANSLWKTLGTVVAGVVGNTLLTVANGGTMAAGMVLVGGTLGSGNSLTDDLVSVRSGGTMQITGLSGQPGLVVGTESGATGRVVVSGTGSLLDSQAAEIEIGGAGSGAMTVSAGASVLAGLTPGLPAAEIGANAGVSGSLLVSDFGSTFNARGQLNVGDAGIGSVLVRNGGALLSGDNTLQPGGGIAIGSGAGGQGEITVTDPGSWLQNVGQFTVGGDLLNGGSAAGIGTLRILNGGAVMTSLPESGFAGPAADIGAEAGTDGSSVTVTGLGSIWQVDGSLVVGDAATGSLNISAGGTVTADALTLGAQVGSSGDVSVNGPASLLSVSGDILVGQSAGGNLHLNNGASLSAQNLTIGGASGGAGVFDAGGASRIDVSGTLIIGGVAPGVLVLGGGVSGSAGTFKIAANGTEVDIDDPFGAGNKINDGTVNKGGNVTETDGTLFNSGTYIIQDNANFTLVADVVTFDNTFSIHVGQFQINNSGTTGTTTFTLNAGTIDVSQTINFANTGFALLNIGTIASFGAVIGSFDSNAEIILNGISIASDIFTPGSGGTNGVLSLYSDIDQTVLLGTIQVAPTVTGTALANLEHINAAGALGTLPCFAAGTRIATLRGEVAVEDLREGDLLPTLIEGRPAPVIWVAHRTVECARHPRPRAVWPVRIRAGAFGPGRPGRDLWVSPDHALYFDGALIPAKYLIDGDAVAQVPLERVTYYHVELPLHDVVLAEGLAAETFLDTGGRQMFANGGGAVALHPDFATRVWEAEGCAPLVVAGPAVAAARRAAAGARAA